MANTNKAGDAGQAAALPVAIDGPLRVHGVLIREHDDGTIGVAFLGEDHRGVGFEVKSAGALRLARALRSGQYVTLPDGNLGRVSVVSGTLSGQTVASELCLLIRAAHADRVADALERHAAWLKSMAEAVA